MKKIMTIFSALICASMFTGCIALQCTTISDLSGGKGSSVSAEAGGMGFLMLTVPDRASLEGAAMKDLKEKGGTKNITSRLTMRNWMIVQYYKVSVSGEKEKQ